MGECKWERRVDFIQVWCLYYILELWAGSQGPPYKLLRKEACLNLVCLFA